MWHLQQATLKRPFSGRSLGMVSSRLPDVLLLCAVLWLGLTSASSSSCSSMPCSMWLLSPFHLGLANLVSHTWPAMLCVSPYMLRVLHSCAAIALLCTCS